MVVAKEKVNGKAAAAPMPEEANLGASIFIQAPRNITLAIWIRGLTPLICHAWSEKARREMLEAQQRDGGQKKMKQKRDPKADFEGARYKASEEIGQPGGKVSKPWDGVPSSGIRGCINGAARLIEGLPMTLIKRLVFIMPDGRDSQGTALTRIHSASPRMREDMVRVGMGTADLRYRPEYTEWSMCMRVRFNANMLSEQHLLNLIETAGTSEGLCEWRPGAPKSLTGTYGMFELDRSKPVASV